MVYNQCVDLRIESVEDLFKLLMETSYKKNHTCEKNLTKTNSLTFKKK